MGNKYSKTISRYLGMFRGDKVLSIIPARKGSKSLPNKNILELNGKPLIHWTIKSSLNCSFIDDTLITTDSNQILKYGKNFGVLLRERPKKLARDNTSMIEVLKNLFEKEPDLIKKYGFLILLQPTSPLRTEKHITKSFIEFEKKKTSDSLISGVEVDNSGLKNLIQGKNGFLKEIDSYGFFSINRQLLPKLFKPNGAIYIIKIKEFLSNGKLITKNTMPFKMTFEDSIDIDSLEDFNRIEKILKSI